MKEWRKLGRTVFMLPLLYIIAVTLSGCSSGHQQFFKSAVADSHPALSEYDKLNLVVFTGEPRVYYQNLDDAAARRLFEDGFVLLGSSSFNGPAEGEGELKGEARRLGAEVVIASSRYSNTVSGAVPITTYSPQTYQTSGTVTTSSGSWANYSGTTTGTSAQTTMMPYSVARYDQSASYWTRTSRPRLLGIKTAPLTAEDRQKIGANQGIRVFACIRDSPAWRANVLAGDYILAVNGQAVSADKDFNDLLASLAGQRVTLSILRGSERMEIPVVLNPNPRI